MSLGHNETEDVLLFFRQTTTRVWFNLYQGCLDRGFDERQAFVLVQTYILANGTADVHPPDGSGPETDDPNKDA
jgi:hypothetical protein